MPDRFLTARQVAELFQLNVETIYDLAGSGTRLWGIDPDDLQGKLPPFLPDVPVVREDLADYFGEIAAFDLALGRPERFRALVDWPPPGPNEPTDSVR